MREVSLAVRLTRVPQYRHFFPDPKHLALQNSYVMLRIVVIKGDTLPDIFEIILIYLNIQQNQFCPFFSMSFFCQLKSFRILGGTEMKR